MSARRAAYRGSVGGSAARSDADGDADTDLARGDRGGDVGPVTTGAGADFRSRAVAETLRRRPELDGTAIAFTLTLNRIAAVHQQESESRVHRVHGWTASGFRVLFMTWLLEPVEARDLARFAGVSRQTISSVLATLEKDGFVTRRQTSRTDRRLVSVRLTAHGRTAMGAAIGEQNAIEHWWFAALDRAEQAQLLSLLDRVLARMLEPEG